MKNELLKTFTELISIDTQSDENSSSFPSTESQSLFAEMLAGKLSTIGIDDVKIDKYSYVTATIPANCDKKQKIGFIAHIDTSPEYNGKGINPIITENYDGSDITLDNDITISPSKFPELKNYIGQTIITADGNSLLGADDKAGVAEILTAAKYLLVHDEIKHGEIKIAFTPDEEIGRGMDFFDAEKFGCDFAYTMDGGEAGELNYENFNAAKGKLTVKGVNVHPGSAKGIMINASTEAMDFVREITKFGVPENTENYEGFVYITSINGNCEKCTVEYIIRSFDKEELKKIETLHKKYAAEKMPAGTTLEITEQYSNMKEVFDGKDCIIDIAKKAVEKTGTPVKLLPIRGGTDGARLSFMGIPCPNIFAGGHNFHGPYEYIPLESMEKAVWVIINIAELAK
ncbi:MAG: peptidase T [Firmicutes bacterium]|nr:peptidase T [Bacillota bacterium]